MLGDGRKRRLRILGPALYALLAAHSMAQPTAVGADTSTARPLSVSGYVWVPYQLRTGAGASDHDLYAIGALHAGDRAHHHLTAHAFARLSYDLDDDQRSATADPFRSVDDAGARPVDGRLYEAYVDGHRLPGLSVLRVGRQTLNQTPRRLHLDGGRAESAEVAPIRVSSGVFGGRPVHLYEQDGAGDAVLGGFLRVRPRTGTRARADVVYLEDENLYGEPRNVLERVAVWQRMGAVDLHAAHVWLDESPREARARATWNEVPWGLVVRGRYAVVFGTEAALVSDLDPFSAVLRAQAPYHRFGALASKRLGAHVSIEGGYDGRRLLDPDDDAPFNRAYDRFHLLSAVRDVGRPGTSVAVTGSLWDSGDRTLASAGGELGYRRRGQLRAAVGTAYALYQDDALLSGAEQDVRSYYARLGVDGPYGLGVDLRYQLDDASDGRYHLLRTTAKWAF